MIECSKCKGRAVSVVSVVNSVRNEGFVTALTIIQLISGFISAMIGVIILVLMSENKELFDQITFVIYEIPDAIKNTSEIAENFIVIKAITGIFTGSLTILVVCGLIRLLLPYRTYSYQKCICRACEFQWEYTPPAGIADIGSEHPKP